MNIFFWKEEKRKIKGIVFRTKKVFIIDGRGENDIVFQIPRPCWESFENR